MLTGLLFGQDVLTLKNGESYKGTFFGKVDEDIVFMMEGETSTKKFSINDVEIIKIKSGELSYPFDVPKIALDLALEEYQKLSTKEKAIYDAKSKNLDKWALYGSISPIIISVYNEVMYWTGGPRISIAFSAAIVTISSYFVLNHQEIFNFPKSILTDSEKEIYEQAYSKELQKRKFIHFLGCSIVTGVAGSLMAGSSTRGFSMSGFDVRFE